MSKQDDKPTRSNPDENLPPDEDHKNLTEPVPAGNEAPESGSHGNVDDLLDDVRKSLIEDETAESNKPTKWWQRIGRGSPKESARSDAPKVPEEIDLPAMTQESVQAEPELDEYADEIDELIDLLKEEEGEQETAAKRVEPPVAQPEKVLDLDELKKQAFQPRATGTPLEDESEVRSIALGGDDEVFVEVESKAPDELEERISAMENALKPYQRYINFGIAFLGLVIAGIALTFIYRAYLTMRPEAVPEQVTNLPYPTSLSLPGGWTFGLGKGQLHSGRWEPQGAEWLEGTEVCRWVSLPWSRQLETVMRTLSPDDSIELVMSNQDKLVYNVYSIRQMSLEEMQQLDSTSPCLLIMLAEDNVEERWVLTALP